MNNLHSFALAFDFTFIPKTKLPLKIKATLHNQTQQFKCISFSLKHAAALLGNG
ncbi:hypothetical protein Hanom_Chr14g01285511 [Helianthus anomalus]